MLVSLEQYFVIVLLILNQYMQQMYPQSSGEIHCYNEEQLALFELWLKDGNKPKLSNPEPEASGIDA